MEAPKISPNGRWVAYGSDTSGRSEVYVQSFPRAEGKWQVSTTGGTEPSWRGDGKELFYIRGDNLMAMSVRTDLQAFEFGVAKPLFEVQLETRPRRRYQVAAKGQRFSLTSPSSRLQSTWRLTGRPGSRPESLVHVFAGSFLV